MQRLGVCVETIDPVRQGSSQQLGLAGGIGDDRTIQRLSPRVLICTEGPPTRCFEVFLLKRPLHYA